MSGSLPLIDQLNFASSQKEVIANRVLNAEAPAAVYGIKTLIALTLVVYGGPIEVSGTPTVLANQTVALTDNTTNYVKASSAGVVSVVTSAPSGWPGPLASNVTALYTIVTSGGVYTSITEWRVAISPPTAATSFVGGTLTGSLNEAPIVTLASAGTVNIGAAAANTITISGTTTITAFDTIASGAIRRLLFAGILTLTHNGTSLILPTGASITTAAGDVAEFVSLGSGNWRCTGYERASGASLSGSAFTGGTLTSALNYAPTVTIASAGTVNIGAAAGNYISVTGTTTITAFDTIAAGAERIITFTGILTLTHNGTSLILPTAANITTAAGDSAWFMSLGSGNWKCLAYSRANGQSVAGSSQTKVIQIACSDETTAITTGAAKVTFRMPYAMTLSEVRASLTTVSSSGNPAIDVNEGGASIFSTTLTIDSGEKTSTTAATPAVISDSSLADDAEITIDIDTAGTGATGLKVTLIGT